MKSLFEKALEAYTSMLLIHINTKTQERDFHEATASFYETLFETAHKIGEKHVDLGGKLNSLSLDEQKKEANKIIKNLREEIEKYAEKKDISLGTEDLLGSLANGLEDIEGTSKSYLNKK